MNRMEKGTGPKQSIFSKKQDQKRAGVKKGA